MSKLKAGIIGLGIGEQHIAGYHSHSACEVVGLCDFSAEKRRVVSEKYPQIDVYETDDAILENPEIDVVSIASYDNYHYEQIVKALKNNKHVFVEKPLCLYEKEAEHIRLLLNDKPGLRLSSNLILRKSPRFSRLKEMIDQGRLGRPYYVEGDYNYGRLHKITDGWRGCIDFYSVVYGGGVHIIDLLLWLMGRKITEVCAYGNNISTRGSQYKYDDMVVAILKFDNDIVGKLGCNFSCVYPHFHNLSIYGTSGTFVNDFEKGRLFCSRDAQAGFEAIEDAYPGTHKGDLIYSFVDSIINDSTAEITADDVFNAMCVCFAVEKAMQIGGSVEVNYI